MYWRAHLVSVTPPAELKVREHSAKAALHRREFRP
jgi:hypothetical protein